MLTEHPHSDPTTAPTRCPTWPLPAAHTKTPWLRHCYHWARPMDPLRLFRNYSPAMILRSESCVCWLQARKGHADPIWAPVEEILLRDFPGHHQQLMDLTDTINIATKRNLFPNPAAYTAIANIIIGIPKEAASWMLWTGRGISWTKIYLHQLAVANAPNVSKHQPEPEPVHERDSES